MYVYYIFYKIKSILILVLKNSIKTVSNSNNFHRYHCQAVQFSLKLKFKEILINTFYKAFSLSLTYSIIYSYFCHSVS